MDFINEFEVKGEVVTLRIDLNLPMDENGEISNLTGLYRRVAPTLQYLQEEQAITVLLASNDSKRSFETVSKKLSEHFKVEIKFISNISELRAKLQTAQAGEVFMCENLAFIQEDKACDKNFAKVLTSLGKVYVVDTFSETNIESASTTMALKITPNPVAGLLIKKELEYYDKTVVNPKRPFCVVLGGAKAAPRLDILQDMAKRADVFLVGGALACTFLAAQGAQMGRSMIERSLTQKILNFIGILARRGSKVYFPVDFRIGDTINTKGMARCVTAQEVPANSMVLDIGPATSILFEEAITNAETILWNGPMGTLENEDYAEGTTQLIQSLASAHGLTVAGGIATESAVHQMELEHRFDHLSTGGQAFLDMIQGKRLVGLAAFDDE